MTEEDRLDAQIAKMFDELTETHVTRLGKAVSQRTLLDEALKGDEMREACERLVAEHKKWERIDGDPRKYYDREIRLLWWDRLEKLYAAERAVWRLFVGDHPTPESNRQYARWRADYLEGKNIKLNA